MSHLKNSRRAKVVTGKTFTVLTASPNTGKRVPYLIVIVARAHSLFFDMEQYLDPDSDIDIAKSFMLRRLQLY